MPISNILQFAIKVSSEPSNIIEFPSTAGFKSFHEFFVKESVKHPAKANLHMLRWIIEKYTKEGEIILDPMAGTFSTCIMASLLGRNSIGLEYEQKFMDIGKANVERL